MKAAIIFFLALPPFLIAGLAIYGLRAKHPRLYKALFVFVVLGWIANLLINQALHILLWDFQDTPMITPRLRRYLAQGAGWRYRMATRARRLINALDKGHL